MAANLLALCVFDKHLLAPRKEAGAEDGIKLWLGEERVVVTVLAHFLLGGRWGV